MRELPGMATAEPPVFDEEHWWNYIQASKNFKEHDVRVKEYEEAMDDYDKQVQEHAKLYPHMYTTHKDKSGRAYTEDAKGNRTYQNIISCDKCDARNDEDDIEWWQKHMAEHAHKEAFDLEREPMVIAMRKYAGEYWFGEAHVRRWNQALAARGINTPERAMTYEEARKCYNKFSKKRWKPIYFWLAAQEGKKKAGD